MFRRNPLPMGTAAAAGQATPSMQTLMAKAYGSTGGRRSAAKRGKAKKAATSKRRGRKSGKRTTLNGRKMTAKQAKYFGKRKRK